MSRMVLRLFAGIVSATLLTLVLGLAAAPAQEGRPARAAPIPTPTPGLLKPRFPRKVVLSPARPARRVPADVPAQMAWQGLGGGSMPVCVDLTTAPARTVSPDDVILPAGTLFWCYCPYDLPDNDPVTATLALPDGSRRQLISQTFDASALDIEGLSGTCAQFDYHFPVVPSPGPVTFTASISSVAVSDVLTPLLGVVDFSGWRPDEPVRLVSYVAVPSDPASAKAFVDDIFTTAGSDGALRVQVADPGDAVPNVTLFAIGKDTRCLMYDPAFFQTSRPVAENCATADPNLVGPGGGYANVEWTYALGPVYTWQPCQDGPVSHLAPGQRAAVSRIAAVLRAAPSLQSKAVGTALAGQSMQITGGPKCAEGAVWWQARLGRGNTAGWVRETNGALTWLARR